MCASVCMLCACVLSMCIYARTRAECVHVCTHVPSACICAHTCVLSMLCAHACAKYVHTHMGVMGESWLRRESPATCLLRIDSNRQLCDLHSSTVPSSVPWGHLSLAPKPWDVLFPHWSQRGLGQGNGALVL